MFGLGGRLHEFNNTPENRLEILLKKSEDQKRTGKICKLVFDYKYDRF